VDRCGEYFGWWGLYSQVVTDVLHHGGNDSFVGRSLNNGIKGLMGYWVGLGKLK